MGKRIVQHEQTLSLPSCGSSSTIETEAEEDTGQIYFLGRQVVTVKERLWMHVGGGSPCLLTHA